MGGSHIGIDSRNVSPAPRLGRVSAGSATGRAPHPAVALHLRDGSGNAKNGDNDLTVTTNEAQYVGDVITIKGTLRTDKDFGSGYSYAVIVDEASIVK